MRGRSAARRGGALTSRRVYECICTVTPPRVPSPPRPAPPRAPRRGHACTQRADSENRKNQPIMIDTDRRPTREKLENSPTKMDCCWLDRVIRSVNKNHLIYTPACPYPHARVLAPRHNLIISIIGILLLMKVSLFSPSVRQMYIFIV